MDGLTQLVFEKQLSQKMNARKELGFIRSMIETLLKDAGAPCASVKKLVNFRKKHLIIQLQKTYAFQQKDR